MVTHAFTENDVPLLMTPLAEACELPKLTLCDGAILPLSRSELPSLEELHELLQETWSTRVLTNNGPLHKSFELALSEYLQVDHITLVANATLGLMLAVTAVGSGAEVITSPFTFVATAHALSWCGVKPVFVDIEPDSWSLDPSRIEAAITEHTRAVLPVHRFGRVCDIDAIAGVANDYNIPVVYDAAHGFGVNWRDQSLLAQGAASVVSLHASKVFNSFEGGAIVSANAELKQKLDRLRNFGIVDETSVQDVGLNAKMSELHAAVGLLQLRHVDSAILRRRAIDTRYRQAIRAIPGIRSLEHDAEQTTNGGYFPILIESGCKLSRNDLESRLREMGIMARKYFFPLVSTFSMYCHLPSSSLENLPNAHDVASRVLCLPIYPTMRERDQDRVIEALTQLC